MAKAAKKVKKAKISEADADKATEIVGRVMSEKVKGKFGSQFRKAGGFFQRTISKKAYARYLSQGGKSGDWESFFKWLISEGLPMLIQLLMPLFKPV